MKYGMMTNMKCGMTGPSLLKRIFKKNHDFFIILKSNFKFNSYNNEVGIKTLIIFLLKKDRLYH